MGVVLGAGLIIGVLTWLCISQRRQRRRALTRQSEGDNAPSQDAAMTEVTSTRRRGLTQDYFGPDAVPGPFTETATSAATSPSPGRAVPHRPHMPGDIAAPVEIDSRLKGDEDGPSSPGFNFSTYETSAEQTVDGRFELPGSDPISQRSPSLLPTPLSPRSEGPKPPDS